MFACICGGAVEVGLLACLVSSLSCAGTAFYNRKRQAIYLRSERESHDCGDECRVSEECSDEQP